jgi:hypothetical protein
LCAFTNSFCFSVKITCAKTAKAEPFIHGGIKVKDREYPWIGAYFSNGGFRCGGNLSKFFFDTKTH